MTNHPGGIEMNNFERKKQQRVERFKELAEKNEKLSDEYYKQSNETVACIPMGQPILVGHHSEQAHRNRLKRSWNQMGKSVMCFNKVKYYKQRAAAAESTKAIFSDDPEAVVKMREKLKDLEKTRKHMKKINAAWRKFEKTGNRQILIDAGLKESQIISMINSIEKAYPWEKQPYAKYQLSNLGGNIRNCKLRLEKLEKAATETTTEKTDGDIKIVDNVEDNRLQIFFPGIPPVKIRTRLKSYGFRWSRYNGCWQRHRSIQANSLADIIVQEFKEVKN